MVIRIEELGLLDWRPSGMAVDPPVLVGGQCRSLPYWSIALLLEQGRCQFDSCTTMSLVLSSLSVVALSHIGQVGRYNRPGSALGIGNGQGGNFAMASAKVFAIARKPMLVGCSSLTHQSRYVSSSSSMGRKSRTATDCFA